jgi:CRISPR/Cas system endoribonuclease Cas6 (RAMP superfamily)
LDGFTSSSTLTSTREWENDLAEIDKIHDVHLKEYEHKKKADQILAEENTRITNDLLKANLTKKGGKSRSTVTGSPITVGQKPDSGDQRPHKESMDYMTWADKEEKLKLEKELKKRYHNLKSVDLDLEEEDMNDIRKALLKKYNVKPTREDIYEDIYCE